MRVKWEIPTLMVLVLLLGAWLVWSHKGSIFGPEATPGTRAVELRVGNSRGIVEVRTRSVEGVPAERGTREDLSHEFRVRLRDGFESDWMNARAFRETFGARAYEDAVTPRENAIFRLLNITSWSGLAWAGLGLLGQGAFFGRMFVQWVVSERRKQSVVPPVFWWFSLAGGVLLFTYFVWRQDFVGVLGQSTGIVIYGRNLKLIAKEQRRAREAALNGSNG